MLISITMILVFCNYDGVNAWRRRRHPPKTVYGELTIYFPPFVKVSKDTIYFQNIVISEKKAIF